MPIYPFENRLQRSARLMRAAATRLTNEQLGAKMNGRRAVDLPIDQVPFLIAEADARGFLCDR